MFIDRKIRDNFSTKRDNFVKVFKFRVSFDKEIDVTKKESFA